MSGGKRPKFGKKGASSKRSKWPAEEQEIASLEARLAASCPARGWHPETQLEGPPDEMRENNKQETQHEEAVKVFRELALSARTQAGLATAGLKVMRPIQRATIPHALAGRDVLGAARTGSGKTVAFLVPVLEKLYRERWTGEAGLGAMIVAPTRELAQQIFEVLRVVGGNHDFSAAAVVGGAKDVSFEKARIGRMALVVATLGRMLQHLQETASLDASQVLVFVVDEADRAVDMGFAPQLDAVVSYLPRDRQTLLFSATLGGSTSVLEPGRALKVSPKLQRLRNLVRASNVEFVVAATDHQAVGCSGGNKKNNTATVGSSGSSLVSGQHDSSTPTPRRLRQCYVVCELYEKLDVLYAFVKAHLRCKCLVFASACSQVRYLFEALRGLQPGVPLLALHGKQKQAKRTAVYYDFLNKQHAVLFATDVAARGLDFPKIDWVVQLDAPEDADAYVHRAGRAARGETEGDAMLILLPSEEARVASLLKTAKIPIAKLCVNPAKRSTLTAGPHVEALVASRPDMKDLAQKAFRAYVRSVVLAKDKLAFQVDKLPLAEYARSLGLAAQPPVALPTADQADAVRQAAHDKKNQNRKLQKLKDSIKAKKLAKKGASASSSATANKNMSADRPSSSAPPSALLDDDDLFDESRAKRPLDDDDDDDGIDLEGKKKTKQPKLRIRGGVDVKTRAKKTVFDDRGRAHSTALPDIDTQAPLEPLDPSALAAKNASFVQQMRARLQAAEKEDRAQEKAARRERKAKKAAAKRKRQEEDDDHHHHGGGAVLLAAPDDDDDL